MPANTNMQPAQEIAHLKEEIRRHDFHYYVQDNPLISDLDYDRLLSRLTALEKHNPGLLDPDSPTQRVAGTPLQSFVQVQHPTPMLSLANAFSEQDFIAWHSRTAKLLGTDSFSMNAELKIDGLAVRIVYKDGRLELAATRGNGSTGEDVTHNVRTARNLPLRLQDNSPPPLLEARGEIYMPKSTFERLNQAKLDRGEEPFANPRNAAAGGIRQLDQNLAFHRGLRAWLYSTSAEGMTTHSQGLNYLSDLGLPVNPCSRLCTSLQEVQDFYHTVLEDRHCWDYEADGVVIKVDNLHHQETLGATGREPRWAVAWKFPSEKVTTKLLRIDLSHGRFGKLTPVAVLHPVQVGGVTVKSATLHNEQDIRRKNIREGSQVFLERAGDVIPQVTGPADPAHNDTLPPFQMPDRCPACNSGVEQLPGEAAHWCPNDDCPARLPEQLRHFVSKNAMDIEGLGPHWCDSLVHNKLVTNPADLYNLTKHQWLFLDRMGEKTADRILANIQQSKAQTPQRVLYSLGIFRLGREVSSILAETCNSIEEVLALTLSDLTAMDGIGPVIAESVVKGLASDRVRQTIHTMREQGVRALSAPDPTYPTFTQKEKPNVNKPQAGPLDGKTVVITGKAEGHTRQEMEAAVARMGGNAASSVTAKTDYLVVGDKPGSKLAKAQKLGVTVISDQEFFQMLNGSPDE